MLESLKQDSTYMQQRAARQAEARERWVEGLSFQPASIKQPDRPPLSAADQAKETVEPTATSSVTAWSSASASVTLAAAFSCS